MGGAKHIIALFFFTILGFSQNNIIPLWENEIPNSQKSDEVEQRDVDGILRISKVQIPTLEVFLPASNSI